MSSSQQYGRRMDDVWRALRELQDRADENRQAIRRIDDQGKALAKRLDEMSMSDEIEKGIREGLKAQRLARYSWGEKLIGLSVAIASVGGFVLGILYHVGG